MAFQKVVNKLQGFGVVGEIYDSAPSVVDTYIIDSELDNNFGNAFTSTVEGEAVSGGTGVFAGILVNPKSSLNYNGGLSPNDVATKGTAGELLTKGRVIVNLGGTANIGDAVYFDQTTGELGAGTAGAGQTQIVDCKVVLFTVSDNGLGVIELGKTF